MSIARELAEALGEEYRMERARLAFFLHSPQMRWQPPPQALSIRIAAKRLRVAKLRALLNRAAQELPALLEKDETP